MNAPLNRLTLRLKQTATRVQMLRPIRKTLRRPAARWYLNELQIEADYAAAVALQQNPTWYRGMMLLINRERLLETHEVPQVFQSKKYPANNMSTGSKAL